MARRAARVDDNQQEIVEALLKAGASVLYLHGVGMGAPDLCIGFRGKNWLLELKDGNKPPSARKLTPMQKRWHQQWGGHVAVVKDADEALSAIGIAAAGQPKTTGAAPQHDPQGVVKWRI